MLRYVSEYKLEAQIGLSGRIDGDTLKKINAEVYGVLYRFGKPVERTDIKDIEDYSIDR